MINDDDDDDVFFFDNVDVNDDDGDKLGMDAHCCMGFMLI